MPPDQNVSLPASFLGPTAGSALTTTPGLDWIVAHTKPRCEKKFERLLQCETIPHELPLVTSIRRYQNQTKRFTKPLFPSYVFVQLDPTLKNRLYQQDLLVRIIPVPDQQGFCRQLESVLTLVRSGLPLQLSPLRKGARVRITGGPLHGVQGIIDDPDHPRGIIVAVDVLQQGVLVRLPPENLERID